MLVFLVTCVLVSALLASSSSYSSGFVDIDTPATAGSIFYAFAPPANNDTAAPLILWLQGGPGSSGLQFGFIQELGPLRMDAAGAGLTPRTDGGAWNAEFAVLFVDQPVGTGYSTVRGGAYAANQTAVAEGLLAFLERWYALGLWARSNPFFIAGESYGGHYVPALAHYILQQRGLGHAFARSLSLSGIAVGDGFTVPEQQVVTKPASAFNFGLIDATTRDAAQRLADHAAGLCRQGEWALAFQSRAAMEQLIIEACGYCNPYDVRRMGNYSGADDAVAAFLNSSAGKRAFNVPDALQFGTDPQVRTALVADEMQSFGGLIPDLIDQLPAGVLLYQGQFDWKDGYASNSAWLDQLAWPGAAAFSASARVVWHSAEGPAGWRKGPVRGNGSGGLTQVVVNGAGHLAPMDQPVAMRTLITTFIRGTWGY